MAYWLKDQGLKKSGRSVELPVSAKGKLVTLAALPVYAVLHVLHRIADFLGSERSSKENYAAGFGPLSNKLKDRIGSFDLVEAYGTDIIIPYLLNKPYIAYEHGTLRDLPFENSERAVLLSAAYQNAELTVISNPDTRESAHRLGLKNIIYIQAEHGSGRDRNTHREFAGSTRTGKSAFGRITC